MLQDQQPERHINSRGATLQSAWGLIDSRPLIREALIYIIEHTGGPPVAGANSAQDFLNRIAQSDLRINLIMLHAANGRMKPEQLCADFLLLRKGMVGVPVVVLGDEIDLDAIGHVLRAGARGYIPTSWSSAEVMQALKHVQAGSVHAPSEALPHLLKNFHNGAQQSSREALHEKRRFTPRQLEVLKLVRQGKPNKIIAHELDMQESTVKVHVRGIMKKLKVSNRTEAAFRAGQLLANLDDHDARGFDGTSRLAG